MDKHGVLFAKPLFGAFSVGCRCVEPGCGADATVRRHRLCAKHYDTRRRMLGTPGGKQPACARQPCLRPVCAHGLCRSHYNKAWRAGVFKHLPAPVFPAGPCSAMDSTDESSTWAPGLGAPSATASCDEASIDSGAHENWCLPLYSTPVVECGQEAQCSVPPVSLIGLQ